MSVKKNITYLGLGTNLGDRKKQLVAAIQEIKSSCGVVRKISHIYETAPWGGIEQPNFYNQVIEVSTSLEAEDLLKMCLAIEQKLGRVRQQHWGARIIDIDILLYNQQVFDTPHLQIPHPYMHQRRFVLEPLKEIAPTVIHPILGLNALQLLNNCSDTLKTTTIT